MRKKDKYGELGCEFLNESECGEELKDEGTTIEEAEEKHFYNTDGNIQLVKTHED